VRLRLTPRDTSFFDLLAASAAHLVTGANLLAELLGADRATRKALAKQMSEAEHLADEATHQIMRRLNQTFVTPFDRAGASGPFAASLHGKTPGRSAGPAL
jgi:uncharacterized protein Yka (UPF0111/DUF47 family)